MTFQRRRFVMCIYALFLILSVTISICIFETKAEDKVLCPLQYENLECYSDKQGKIVTLQRGDGQTIIGSSKDGDPITHAQEYDFSKKCENSIYLFKNHEDTSGKKVDIAVYSIAKHKIYCKKTFNISIPDPKRCAVLEGGIVCILSLHARENVYICKCTPNGNMKVHNFRKKIESISASPDNSLLYVRFVDKNEVEIYHVTLKKGSLIPCKCENTIKISADIKPTFLDEKVFIDTDSVTYIKNEDEFVPFVKLDIFEDRICFGNPYLIYASDSDKINFVDVTSSEEYASMKVDGEVVYLTASGTSFVYVVKRDGKLFYKKMKVDDAIEKISLAATEEKKTVSMDKHKSVNDGSAHEKDDEVMDQEPKTARKDTSVKDDTQAKEVSVDQDVKDETIHLVKDDEVKQSIEELQVQIEQKEIEQNLEEVAAQQMSDVSEASEGSVAVEQPEPIKVQDEQKKKDTTDQAEMVQVSAGDEEITEKEVQDSLEQVQAQIEKKEIDQKLEEIATQQIQKQTVNADEALEDSVAVEQPEPIKVPDGEELPENPAAEKTSKGSLLEEASTVLKAVQEQVAHNEIEKQLDAIAEKAAKDSGIFVSKPIIDELSTDDEEKKDMTDQAEVEQVSASDEEITEKEVQDSLEQVQAQIEKKEIDQKLEEIDTQQIQKQAVNADEALEDSVAVEQPEPIKVPDGEELHENPAEEKSSKGSLLEKASTVLEAVQEQVAHNEIEKQLDAIAEKAQCDDGQCAQASQVQLSDKADSLPSLQTIVTEQKWKPLKITKGLFDSTEAKVPKDKKKKIESRIISHKVSGKVTSTMKQDKQIPNKDVSELHQVSAVDLLDKATDSNSTEVQQIKRIKLRTSKRDRNETEGSQLEQIAANKNLEGLKRNIRAPQGPKRKRARLMSLKDDINLARANITQKKLVQGVGLSSTSEQVKHVNSINKNVLAVPVNEHLDKSIALRAQKPRKTKSDIRQSKQIHEDKKPEELKRNIRAPQGPKRKRARLMSLKDDINLARSNMMQEKFAQNVVLSSTSGQTESAQDKIVPSDVWRASANENNKKQYRKEPKVKLSKSDITKVNQISSRKGKLRKSVSERSILSGDLLPHIQKSEVKNLRRNSSTSSRKKLTRLQEVRERISKSMLYKLDSKKNFIRGVDVKTSLSQFKKNIDLAEDVNVVFKKKGKPVTSGNIGTNTIMEFNTDDMGLTTLVAVVPGDLTGSGKMNKSSLKTMCRHIFREKMLEGAYFEAGDINGDGVVDTLDLLLLSKMIEERS